MSSVVDCSSITTMLVFIRPLCSGKYLNKETQHTQERREKGKGCFSSSFYTSLQRVGAVFTDGSLAGSLGRSFICPTVQLSVSRCQQKGRGDFAEPGGSWQDQNCLSLSPAASWGGLSAYSHPEKPGLCFFKVFFKGVAALSCDMHRQSRSCSSHLAVFLLWVDVVKGCGCCMTAGSGLWWLSCGRNLAGLCEQGALV